MARRRCAGFGLEAFAIVLDDVLTGSLLSLPIQLRIEPLGTCAAAVPDGASAAASRASMTGANSLLFVHATAAVAAARRFMAAAVGVVAFHGWTMDDV